MEHSDLSVGARCPLLLQKHGKFVELLIERIHKNLLHSEVAQTLSKIRYGYWIIRGRATVKSVLKKCCVCRRVEGGPYKMPRMPPLPRSRVTESVPFSRIGLNYLGPLQIRTRSGPKKVWVCLFTCLVTRGIHLEMVEDMTTEEFLMAFRRFISQKGVPTEVISDNALQFKAARKTLENILRKVIKSEDVQSYSSNNGIKWYFIVELAPWMGGFYERLVGLVNKVLKKTLGRNLLTSIQLQTWLKEAEAVVNSRPLVYVVEDLDSSITLTHRHFLSFNLDLSIPDLNVEEDDDNKEYVPYESTSSKLLNIWKKGGKMLRVFWKLWRDEYKLSLRERSQSFLKSKQIKAHLPPKIGDIVQVKDDLPRGCWKIEKVIKLVKSCDGEIRSAKLLLASGRVIGRALCMLFPLEVSENSDICEKN